VLVVDERSTIGERGELSKHISIGETESHQPPSSTDDQARKVN